VGEMFPSLFSLRGLAQNSLERQTLIATTYIAEIAALHWGIVARDTKAVKETFLLNDLVQNDA